MRPGLPKIIQKLHTSRYFESPEIDDHLSENVCCTDYTFPWTSKQVHSLSKSQCSHRGTSDYKCMDTLELTTRIAWLHLPIMGIDMRVAPRSRIRWLPATLHNTRCINHCEIFLGSVEGIPILDPVDVEETYSHIASRYHSLQWHVWSYGWRNVSFG